MDQTRIGLIVVAVSGVALAALATWTMWPAAPAPIEAPEVDDVGEVIAERVEDTGETTPAAPMRFREGAGIVARSVDDLARPSVGQPRPEDDPLLDELGMSADERALLSEDVFSDLGRGASHAAVRSRVEEVLAHVDELAARGMDDEAQAMRRAATMVESVASKIPVEPPPDLAPDAMHAWMEERDALIQGLHAEAMELREAAEPPLPEPPPAP